MKRQCLYQLVLVSRIHPQKPGQQSLALVRSCTNKPLITSTGWRNDLEWEEEETAVPPT